MRGTRAFRWAGLLALMGVAGLILRASADDSLPFKGRAFEVVTSATPTPDGLLVTAVGGGEATYLGRFTREATVLIRADGTLDGTVTFTAANGDQLFADIDGAPTPPPTLAGTYTFTGGTGRFEGASGSASFEGFTTDFIHVALTFEGTIEF